MSQIILKFNESRRTLHIQEHLTGFQKPQIKLTRSWPLLANQIVRCHTIPDGWVARFSEVYYLSLFYS